MAQLWDSFGQVPTESELKDLAKKRLRFGVKEHVADCKYKWCCPGCKTVYPPQQNLLVDLPEFKCCKCNIENPTCQSWKVTESVINNIQLEFRVYNQGDSRHCGVYSVVAAVDWARRLQAGMVGCYATAKFHVLDMVGRYEDITRLRCGFEPSSSLYDGYDNIPIVLTIVKNHGIPYARGSLDAPGSAGSLKIKNFFKVDKTNVSLMKKLLANGIPLVAGIRFGALFQFVNSDQKYLSPEEGLGHALALIGTGMEVNKNTGKLEVYFIARDSAGCKAHSTWEKKGFGGDVFLWASDLVSVWGIRLE